eukprot:115893-Amphidinium_carterae.2
MWLGHRSTGQLVSRIKEIKLSWGSRPVVIGKHRLDGIRVREGCAPAVETRPVLRTEDHRYIQAVREETAVSAHIVSAETDERTIVYPERLILRVKAPTAATPPVSWR